MKLTKNPFKRIYIIGFATLILSLSSISAFKFYKNSGLSYQNVLQIDIAQVNTDQDKGENKKNDYVFYNFLYNLVFKFSDKLLEQ